MQRALAGLVWAALLVSLASCGKKDGVQFYSDNFPAKLSDWRLLTRTGDGFAAAAELVPYDLNTPLFSDYALKFRAVYVPAGKKVEYRETGVLRFPVGTILTKTFYFPRKADMHESFTFPSNKDYFVLETRLLVHTSDGWVGLPYIWNPEGTEAVLEITGGQKQVASFDFESRPIHFNYTIPNQNQCVGCHVTGKNEDKVMTPIGPKARQLNKPYPYPGGSANQLARFKNLGVLVGLNAPGENGILAGVPRNPVYLDEKSGSLADRARAYLDANCAHCHSAGGPANTSALLLDYEESEAHRFGVCKSPTAAGKATAGMDYDIVPGQPDQSILVHRMTSTEPGIRMPELARSLLHREGLALVRAWIMKMNGNCN